jgi:hypothetical protein
VLHIRPWEIELLTWRQWRDCRRYIDKLNEH